jgi:hypothetical protein
MVATISLAAAGFAAAHGRPPWMGQGQPSTNPPSWSQGSSGQGHVSTNGQASRHNGGRNH